MRLEIPNASLNRPNTWALLRAIVGGTIAVTTAPRIRNGRCQGIVFALIVVVLGVIVIGRHGDSVRGAAVTIGLLALLEGTREVSEPVFCHRAERRLRSSRRRPRSGPGVMTEPFGERPGSGGGTRMGVAAVTVEVADGAIMPPDMDYVVDQLQRMCGQSAGRVRRARARLFVPDRSGVTFAEAKLIRTDGSSSAIRPKEQQTS